MTNKELVLKFYDEVFNNWDISNLDDYMKDNYIQHNPTAPDGKEGFIEFTKFFFGLNHIWISSISVKMEIWYMYFSNVHWKMVQSIKYVISTVSKMENWQSTGM